MQSVYEYVIMMIDLSFCESLLALENSRATEQKGAIICVCGLGYDSFMRHYEISLCHWSCVVGYNLKLVCQTLIW